LGWVPDGWVSAQFAAGISSSPVILALSVATLIEILASKIPGVDHLLDLVGAPLAIGAGTLLGSNALYQIEDPLLRHALGFIAGGGAAGIIHAGTAALRIVSTKTTAALANPFLALGETLAAAASSLLAIFLPVIAIIALALLMTLAFFLLLRRLRRKSGA
jgi:hypothetical protein